MQLTMVPQRWYSWDFTVTSGERRVAVLDLAVWRERATIMIGDVTHRVFRERAMSGDFLIEAGGRELARATKPSCFRDTMIVHYGGREYTLRKPSIWRRTFVLMDGERQIGSIAPESMWSRRATAEFPQEWPTPITLFVIWLVIVLWKRDAESAAAA
jgi:hypothetical protein